MKKRLLITVLILGLASFTLPSSAGNFGMYKPEEEYGLFDGFKFNFFDRKEGQKLIELKSETPEEKERLKRQKEKPEEYDEYQMYKFMQEGTIAF